jgi:glycosyl transferase family 2
MARLIARGKYLFEGERKFYARGVSYGTFALNSRGEPFPEPERTDADFALMRELGANVVRTYEPPPPWMMEQAAKHGLKVMLGIPWASHLAFLDSREMTREIRNTIAGTIEAMREFREAIFAYTLGNEIRSDIVRWHGPRAISRFLAELRDLGKQADPEGLFTYANYPSTEYLDLADLDLLAFNVYLHREEDFRRYLTHLMALSAELPLVLSETGMDTIREGEESQADLLGWQSRAAFELGLSGFVVFAFTDEWFRGGSEITDWAFGLVSRERTPKLAFRVVAEVFNGELPPPLEIAPKASVVVAAYNAGQTLGACLASVADLNYPDYETIVVDDGSTDSTASIAEAAGVRVIRRDHRGLGAARNAGADAARGEIVAFIDADACADRNWLYHLVETVVRRKCPAGGPNFPPAAGSPMAALIAAAPGPPREVPLGDDSLAQLCGCNMAIEKAALKKLGGFDPMFTRAGDDVDLSWRLRDAGTTLAYAPGAIVIHQRRASLDAYLSQQRGYGAGEGLLMRKHPLHPAAADGVYGGGGSLMAALFGSGRIYYGAFGRGLFQSLYPARSVEPVLQVPLSIQWLGVAAILIVAGVFGSPLGFLGFTALAISLACAAAAAMAAPLDRAHSGPRARVTLVGLCLLGPLVRSIERERVRWRFEPGPTAPRPGRALQMRGAIVLVAEEGTSIAAKPILDNLRAALVRRGLTVAPSDGFQPYDLQIRLPPAIRVPINALDEGTRRLTLRWRLSLARGPLAIGACVLAILLLIAGFSPPDVVFVIAAAACAFLAFAASRVTLIPAILRACADQAREPAMRLVSSDGGNA